MRRFGQGSSEQDIPLANNIGARLVGAGMRFVKGGSVILPNSLFFLLFFQKSIDFASKI